MKDLTETKHIQSFTVVYDSDDEKSPLTQHEMALSDLTLALQGMQDVLGAANSILNGKESEFDVRVKAGFKEGSFGIIFELLSSPGAVDILKYIGIASSAGFFSRGMALSVINKLQGRPIDVIRTNENGDVSISVDGEVIECDEHAKRLIVDNRFRKAVSKMFTKAGRQSGMDKIGVELGGGAVQSVSSDQADLMICPDELFKTSVEVKEVEDAKVKFITAHADRSGGWRVEYLGKTIPVKILDVAFLEKIKAAEANFSFGRTFNVRLKETITKKTNSNRARRTYEIDKVHSEVSEQL